MIKTSEQIKISRNEMMGVTQRILELTGTPSSCASSVANSRIQPQEAGQASYGIFRLLENSKIVETGEVLPDAVPLIIQESAFKSIISRETCPIGFI